jgi:hypothetical protein
MDEMETNVRSLLNQSVKIVQKYGKRKDSAWIANGVDGCFSGEALRWHAQLDGEIKDDWTLLERALLERYPSTKSLHILQSTR